MKAKHFTLEELVDRDTFFSEGEKAWDLLHPDALVSLDGIREFFQLPVTVNNWKWDGDFQYRGYRPPHCNIGAEHSYHRRGMAFDFDVKGMTAHDVRNAILSNRTDGRLWKIMCLEDDVSWVHFDVGEIPKGQSRIYVFRA